MIHFANIITQAAPVRQPDPFFPFVLLAIFMVFIYFMSIRPQNKRIKEHKAMLDAITRGDVIVTNGGIVGKVKKVNEDELTVDIGAGDVKVVRRMVTDVRTRTGSSNDSDKKKA